MKLLISVLALGMALSACAPVQDADKDKDKTPGALINQTDYSVCGTGDAGRNIVGTWRYQQGIGDLKFVKTYQFSRDYLRVTNDCNFDGAPVRATAATRLVMGNNTVSFLDSVTTETPVQREGYKLTCQAKIDPVDYNYRFQGNCLVLMAQDGRGSITLTPVSN